MFVSLLWQAHLCFHMRILCINLYISSRICQNAIDVTLPNVVKKERKKKKKVVERGGELEGGGEEYPPPCVWSTLLAPVNANKWESEPAAAMRYSQGHDRHILVSHLSLFCYCPRINHFPRHSSVWLQIQFLISNDDSVQWAQTVVPPPNPPTPLGNMEALKLLQGRRTLFLIHPNRDMTKYGRKKKMSKTEKTPKQTNKQIRSIARRYTKHWPFSCFIYF